MNIVYNGRSVGYGRVKAMAKVGDGILLMVNATPSRLDLLIPIGASYTLIGGSATRHAEFNDTMKTLAEGGE